MTAALSRIRRPRTAQPASFTPDQVGRAYHFPAGTTGAGYSVGIIELGGGFSVAEVDKYLAGLGITRTGQLKVDTRAGGKNQPDGPNGADGEVLLDIEVVLANAPGADVTVYFAPNTDAGFAKAIGLAIEDGCTAVSISWGGPENAWDPASINKLFRPVFAKGRASQSVVLAAAGDSGSQDSGGDGRSHVDYPASDPDVLGCGGTRLEVDGGGERASETVWNDDPTSSATGGGKSMLFAGRTVPDIAGNADPDSGYEILVDGERAVIGGTSAVAPLMAAMVVRISEAIGQPLGKATDLLNFLGTNPTVCYDVTVGNNGAWKAGNGKDNVTGFGVPDAGRIGDVILKGNPLPPPVPNPDPAPIPAPIPAPPAPVPAPTTTVALTPAMIVWARRTAAGKCWNSTADRSAARALLAEAGLRA